MPLTLSELRCERFFHIYIPHVLPTNLIRSCPIQKEAPGTICCVSATHEVKVEPTCMNTMLQIGSKLSRVAQHKFPFLLWKDAASLWNMESSWSINILWNDYVFPCSVDYQPIWQPVFYLYAEHFFLTLIFHHIEQLLKSQIFCPYPSKWW
jgi:hypothetical protein